MRRNEKADMHRFSVDRDAILACKEEVLIWILTVISPSDIACRQDLLSAFWQFLERGTPKDLGALLPKTILPKTKSRPPPGCSRLGSVRPPKESASQVSLQPVTPESLLNAPCLDAIVPVRSTQGLLQSINPLVWTSPILSSGHGKFPSSAFSSSPPPSLHPHSKDFAITFFESRVGPKQIAIVLRALRAILNCSEKPESDCPVNIWSQTKSIFASTEAFTHPIKRIRHVRDRIDNTIAGCEILRHVSHLLYRHDVDEYEGWHQGPLPRCVSGKTIAFAEVAKTLDEDIQKVRYEYHRCSNYKHLFENGGPGFLLVLGIEVSTLWRQEISKESIIALLEFLRLYCQHIFNKARNLDCHGSQLIYNGLIAHGWTESTLKSESWLLKGLGSRVKRAAATDVDDDFSTIRGGYNGSEQIGNDTRSSGHKRRRKDHHYQHGLQRLSDPHESSLLPVLGCESNVIGETTPIVRTSVGFLGLDFGEVQNIMVEAPFTEETSTAPATNNRTNIPTITTHYPNHDASSISLVEGESQDFPQNPQNDFQMAVQIIGESIETDSAGGRGVPSEDMIAQSLSVQNSHLATDLFEITNDEHGMLSNWLPGSQLGPELALQQNRHSQLAEIGEGEETLAANGITSNICFDNIDYDLYLMLKGGIEGTNSYDLTDSV